MPYLDTRIRHLRHTAKREGGESLNRFFTVMLQWPSQENLLKLNHGENKYMYKFIPAPRQDDPVIRHLKLLIREINKTNILFANMNIRVAPTTNSPPLWPPNPAQPGVDMKMYTFFDDFNEFPLTTWVTLVPRMNGLRTESLFAKIGSTWVPVTQLLLSMQSSPDLLVGEKGYRAQRKWWRLNGKTFRLMAIPKELRLEIFKYAMGPHVYPRTILTSSMDDPEQFENARVTWGHGKRLIRASNGFSFDWVSGSSSEYTLPKPNLALLLVNREVCKEAQIAGWVDTHKVFIAPNHLMTVVQSGLVPNHKWLNKIVLDFSFFSLYSFFAVRQDSSTGSWGIDTSKSLGYIIPALRTKGLSELQLWFRSPHDGYNFNPYVQPDTYYDYNNEFECCQRTMVDWIMTFAWPFVKDVPTVILGGAVKKASKKKWEYLLSLPKHIQSRAFDYLAEEKAIFSPDQIL